VLSVAMQAAADVEWSTRDHEEVVGEGLAAKKEFIERFFAPSWERRATSGGERSDLISLMQRSGSHFARWDPDVHVREARLFLVAGVATPVRATVHCVNELEHAFHRDEGQRARTSEPGYLRAALAETLRLYPGSPKIRVATADVTLRSGRRISEGSYIV